MFSSSATKPIANMLAQIGREMVLVNAYKRELGVLGEANFLPIYI
jgi:hypothetical protein